ncbi:filamin-A-like [Ornithodoros turicata]|uniref:filamin-A-like n=1 Tax=Ornithodoros turicata TaxID=34597 RepID=UPI0031392DEC
MEYTNGSSDTTAGGMFSQVGMKARSPEGHAARAMQIKGDECVWIEIQEKTFTNWVNEQLRSVGEAVTDLRKDFTDGLRLISLIEVLQKRRLKRIKKPLNQHQCLENVQTALSAMAQDNIKLVNIGNTDIVEGNLKLILGLVWSLILRYQIGRTNFPPKKLMLAWLRAALPDLHITNFTSDWNSGVSLAALLEYCRPGVFPHWKTLSNSTSHENCRLVMQRAKDEFGVPMILTPEDLASPNLDELSGMTYLSYFMNEGSPGYWSTLRWVQKHLSQLQITNFTSDWNDGLALCSLVHSLGAPIENFQHLSRERSHWEGNLQKGINGGKYLGVEPLLTAKELADPEVQPLGVMAYIARFQWLKPKLRPQDKVVIVGTDLNNVHINKPAHFKLNFKDSGLDLRQVRAQVRGPSSAPVECKLQLNKSNGTGTFVPTEVGMHELNIYCEGELVSNCPMQIRVHPDISRILFSGIDPCALGSLVEVLINSNGAGTGNIHVEAVSPSGKTRQCTVKDNDGVFTSTFMPNEIGEWKIDVMYSGEHIQGSPFTCYVYDPTQVSMKGPSSVRVGEEVMFQCDASKAGWGKVNIDVQVDGHSVPLTSDERGNGVYHITFLALKEGKYSVFVTFNNVEVRGSPFSINAGSHIVDVASDRPMESLMTQSNMTSNVSSTSSSVFTSSSHSSLLNSKSTRMSSSAQDITSSRDRLAAHHVDVKTTRLETTRRSHENLGSVTSEVTTKVSKVVNSSRPSSVLAVNRPITRPHPKAPPPPTPKKPTTPTTPTSAMPPSPMPPSPIHVAESSRSHDSTTRIEKQSTRTHVETPVTRSYGETQIIRPQTEPAILKQQVESVIMRSYVESPMTRSSNDSPVTRSYVESPMPRTYVDSPMPRSSIESPGTRSFVESPMTRSSADSPVVRTTVISPAVSHISESKRTEERIKEERSVQSVLSDHIQRRAAEITQITQKTSPKGDVAQVKISGDALKLVPVKRPTTFKITAPEFERDDFRVTVTAPSGREFPVRMDVVKPGEFEVEFITPEVGEHVIDMRVHGKPLPGSPFHSHAFDATKIRVGNVPNGVVGRPVEFEINGAEAGSGNLEIMVNGGHVTSQVKPLGEHRFLASFIPHTSTVHTVEMKFNGDKVPGSPWKCDVKEIPRKITPVLREHSLQTFSCGKVTSFDIHAPGCSKNDVVVSISGPGKSRIQHNVVERPDGCRVEFTAFEAGTYHIDVSVAGQKVPGSPFVSKAYDASCISLGDLPQSCVVGQVSQFQVDASRAGEGQLEISVNDGEVPNQVQVLSSGRCLVSFRPLRAAPHVVSIKFNGEDVPGCPVVLAVTEPGRYAVDLSSVDLVSVGTPFRFHINGAGGRDGDVKVTFISPSEVKLPGKVTRSSGGGYDAEFVPQEVGPYVIHVDHAGSPIQGSPGSLKAYDAHRVDVSSVSNGTLGRPVQFTVDVSSAGEGNLAISVTSQGRDVPTVVHPMGGAKFAVSFVPGEAADHVISISFNKEAIPGSPYTVKVQEAGKITAVGTSSLTAASVDKPASLTIQNASGREQDLNIRVEGPDGSPVPCSLKDAGGRNLKVEFLPSRTGEHRIHVAHLGTPIPNSPFTCKVFDIRQIKVRDIPRGIVGKPVTFIVETAHAGPGNLEVMVNNGTVPTTPQAQSLTQYAITFTPTDDRPHVIEVRFNGEHVPGSPFECIIADLSKIKVTGEGVERVPINQPAYFMVDTSGQDIGNLSVNVTGPSQAALKASVTGNHNSGYRVEYTPTEVGDHSVDLRLGSHPLFGSPFMSKVYDASKVRVADIASGVVGRPVYFSIDASQAGAGNLEIIVSVGGRNVPNYVQSEGNAKFRVNFKPSEPLTHTLSVKFNGEPVPGSPFFVKVSDSSQSMVSGPSLRTTSIGRSAKFSIDTKGTENAECKVAITAPSGKKVPVTLKKSSATTFEAEFQPMEVGPNQVNVTLDGNPLAGSPFTCNVYDVSKVRVTGLNPGFINKPVTFQVDALQAGNGTLELVVRTRKSSVCADFAMKSHGIYEVTFVPTEKTPHYVNITFNEEDIPGNPFKIDIRDSPAVVEARSASKTSASPIVARGDGLKQGLVGSTNAFEIDSNGASGDIDIKVTGPTETQVRTNVIKLDDTTYRAEYHTRDVGLYRVEVLHNGNPVTGKPFVVEVCDPSRVKVMDIEDGIVNRTQTFRVDTTRAGRGNLNVVITAGGREVRNSIRESGPGMYKVSYMPKSDLPHKIDVYYNGHQAPGCPQIVEVRDPSHAIIAHGPGLKTAQLSKTSSFIIETGGYGDAKDFDILVTAPNGSPLPVKCFQQKDGSLLAEWTACVAGSHKVEVLYEGKPIAGSPFMCQVFDANRVVLQKVRTTTFSVNEKISFALNRRDAGYSELDVTVTSPLGRNLPIEVKGTPDGDGELIEFTPTVPGKYRIAITYGGIEVPGSPITFIAQDGGTPKVTGNGLSVAQKDIMASFKIDAHGLWGRPDVRIDGPDSEPEMTIEEEEEGVYIVSYLPLESGVFDIHINWNGKDIPGSPFHPKVVDPHKVRAIGGWESLMDEEGRIPLVVGHEKKISMDVTDAGPGKLKVEVRGPSETIEGTLEQASSHRHKLTFTPREEGDYLIYVYYNDFPHPNSPFAAHAEPLVPVPDHTRVVLRGHGLTGAKVGTEAEFVIDGSDAGPGSPEVSLNGVKADIPVQLVPIGNNTYKVTYTPAVPGAYLLNVMWSERQVKGCPLKVTVAATCDASKVQCSGDGLRGGTVGKEIKAFIDTRKAGPGELTAHCMGPHKMAHCELYDHRDGTFTLYLKPQEGGRHLLTVKYGGDHIQGSPFTIRIAGAPDASKVRVYGPGIEPGVLAVYQSRFICDTRGAGAGQLTVRIRGPKGAFRVEMQRESQKDRTILCKYDPTEPGDYRIEVKWSGEHVPGSPFMVMIFDTQEELTRFAQGQFATNQPAAAAATPSDYFGDAYSTAMGQMSWRGSTHEL